MNNNELNKIIEEVINEQEILEIEKNTTIRHKNDETNTRG